MDFSKSLSCHRKGLLPMRLPCLVYSRTCNRKFIELQTYKFSSLSGRTFYFSTCGTVHKMQNSPPWFHLYFLIVNCLNSRILFFLYKVCGQNMYILNPTNYLQRRPLCQPSTLHWHKGQFTQMMSATKGGKGVKHFLTFLIRYEGTCRIGHFFSFCARIVQLGLSCKQLHYQLSH